MALIVWSIAAAAHGLVATVIGFIIMRFILGLAEAANFPASIKAVAMWFPQKERALATGIFNSGTSVGVMRVLRHGWHRHSLRLADGLRVHRRHRPALAVSSGRCSSTRRRNSRASAPRNSNTSRPASRRRRNVKVPWTTLLRYREIWPFLIGKLITDPVWWFYLFWLPSYLETERGQNPLKSALAGSRSSTRFDRRLDRSAGGYPARLIKRGWTVGKARMTTMLIAAVLHAGLDLRVLRGQLRAPAWPSSPWPPACHQAWSANLFTNATDLFPQKVSGSVVGLGATAGGIGGMFMTLLVGLIVQWTGNQQIVFIWAGAMHLASLLLFWLWFRGHFKQVDVDADLDTVARTSRCDRGCIVAIGGVLLGMFVMNRWEFIVSVVKSHGALRRHRRRWAS